MIRRIASFTAILSLAVLLWPCTSKAQTTYTQTAPVMCRSGELNCFSIGLNDSSGTLRGDYSLACNTNAINNFTCHFTLVLDGTTYTGKVTEVTTYFPFPAGYHGSNGGPGPFAYDWTATGDGITLTGSTQGVGHWGNCGLGKGQCAYIDSSTVVVN